MKKIRPEFTLYKYMAFNKNALDSFINEYCWYSSPSSFNDPFDCALVKGEKFNEFFLESKKVLCLTMEHDNLLMWAHYSDCHKGICIEYSPYNDEELATLKTKGVFPNSPNERLLINQNAKKVTYQSTAEIDMYLSSFPDTDQKLVALNRSMIASDTTETFYSEISQGLVMKHESWLYEKEYRIILDGQSRNPLPGKITKIYLGAKMSPQDKRTISILFSQNVELICMGFSLKRYGLIERPLQPELDFKGIGLCFEA